MKWLMVGIIVTAALAIITGSNVILFIHAGIASVFGIRAAYIIFKGLTIEARKESQQLKKIAANEAD